MAVTGATRGIGREIALRLGRAGARVVVGYRTRRDADGLLDDLREQGCEARAELLDVTDFAGCQDFAVRVLEHFGDLDVLVNNAGKVVDKPLYSMAEDDWDTVLDTNLKGAFNVTRAVFGRMMKRGRGRIVNVSSVSALRGLPGQTSYAASKAGLLGFTRALAAEGARFGVAVNAVAPGYIETRMVETLPEKKRSRILKSIPMGRLGRKEEVAEAVLFLASDAASYVTGVVLPVDGGLLL